MGRYDIDAGLRRDDVDVELGLGQFVVRVRCGCSDFSECRGRLHGFECGPQFGAVEASEDLALDNGVAGTDVELAQARIDDRRQRDDGGAHAGAQRFHACHLQPYKDGDNRRDDTDNR